jgi:hypothetical protein
VRLANRAETVVHAEHTLQQGAAATRSAGDEHNGDQVTRLGRRAGDRSVASGGALRLGGECVAHLVFNNESGAIPLAAARAQDE